MEFEIGEKVSLLNEEGKGIVRSYADDGRVMVEIEDGFEIPFYEKELVPIHTENKKKEKKQIIGGSPDQQSTIKDLKNKGVFLAFKPQSDDQILDQVIVNNSDFMLHYTLSEFKSEMYKGISQGSLHPYESKITGTQNLRQFENWRPLNLQLLYYKPNLSHRPNPKNLILKFNASKFFKSEKNIPVLNEKGYCFSIDQFDLNEIDAKKIGSEKPALDQIKVDRPARQVDLHAEKLIKGKSEYGDEDILEYQFTYFENNLEKAQALNYPKIVFIHGLGANILKNKILSYLENKEGILSYGEADPQKYGHGATKVIFKPASKG